MLVIINTFGVKLDFDQKLIESWNLIVQTREWILVLSYLVMKMPLVVELGW